EIAAALTLTGRGGDRMLGLAVALRRLPLTSQALAAGDIDLPRVMVIADEVTGLDDEHVAAVDEAIAGSAPGQTTGQLRATTRRAVMTADPTAARRRKEHAQQDPRVERWDAQPGPAALAGRHLPPASVLAADQNLTALAKQLKAAGVPGTMDTLRAEAFLALLAGTSVDSLLPRDVSASHESAETGGAAASTDHHDPAMAGFLGDPGLTGSAADQVLPGTTHHLSGLRGPANHIAGLSGTGNPSPGRSGTANPSPGLSRTVNPSPGLSRTVNPSPGLSRTVNPSPGLSRTVNPSPALSGTVNPSPGLSGTVNLTMPLATWLGLSDAPGYASGHGPLDASDSHDLAPALAARAGNRWCLTFTDARGRPVAHGCARAGPMEGRRTRAGPRDESGADARAGPGAESGADAPAGPRSRSRADDTGDRWTIAITLLPGSACDHA